MSEAVKSFPGIIRIHLERKIVFNNFRGSYRISLAHRFINYTRFPSFLLSMEPLIRHFSGYDQPLALPLRVTGGQDRPNCPAGLENHNT
jgi:hypothetical protein